MPNLKHIFPYVLGACIWVYAPIWAEDDAAESESPDAEVEQAAEPFVLYRKEFPLGVSLGVGEPMPSQWSLNFGYHINDWLRLRLGFGKADSGSAKASIMGLGAKAMLPSKNFSPFFAFTYSSISFSGNGSIAGVSADATNMYISIGADWIYHTGFHLGIGYNMPFGGNMKAIPFILVGWYFKPSDIF